MIVSPETLTVASPLTSKTRLAPLPLTVKLWGPNPSMSRFLFTTSSPLVNVMVLPVSLWEKTIVSPLRRRRDLGPQRSGPAVRVVHDGQRAHDDSSFEGLEGRPPARSSRPEPPLLASVGMAFEPRENSEGRNIEWLLGRTGP